MRFQKKIQESDFILFPFRTDGFTCQDNLSVTPVFVDAGYIIISSLNTTVQSDNDDDILSFFNSMDHMTYGYFVILALIFLSFVTIAQTLTKKDLVQSNDTINILGIIKKWFTNVWNLIDLFLSQEGYYVDLSPIGLLWFLFLIFAVYYSFYIVLLNLMTTEQLTTSCNPKINTIDDLLEMTGPGRYEPTTLAGFEFVDKLRTANEDSKLGKVWSLMMNDPGSLIDFGMAERDKVMTKFLKISDDMYYLKRVIIERVFALKYTRYICCGSDFQHWNRFAATFHQSRTIATGSGVIAINARLSEHEKLFVRYRMRSLLEFDIFDHLIKKDMAYCTAQLSTFSYEKAELCGNLQSSIDEVKAATIGSYRTLFKCCSAILLLACIAILFEKLLQMKKVAENPTNSIEMTGKEIEEEHKLFDHRKYSEPFHEITCYELRNTPKIFGTTYCIVNPIKEAIPWQSKSQEGTTTEPVTENNIRIPNAITKIAVYQNRNKVKNAILTVEADKLVVDNKSADSIPTSSQPRTFNGRSYIVENSACEHDHLNNNAKKSNVLKLRKKRNEISRIMKGIRHHSGHQSSITPMDIDGGSLGIVRTRRRSSVKIAIGRKKNAIGPTNLGWGKSMRNFQRGYK